MKNLSISLWLIVIIFIDMVNPFAVQANSLREPVIQMNPPSEEWGEQDYIIAFPKPSAEELIKNFPGRLNPGLSPEKADDISRLWVDLYARRIIGQLEHLKGQGNLGNYEVRYDLNGILLWKVSNLESISRIVTEQPESISMIPAGNAACVTGINNLISERILAVSSLGLSQVRPQMGVSAQAASSPPIPTINIVGQAGGGDALYVYGKVAPNSEVSLRVIFQGNPGLTTTERSDSRGFYDIDLDQGCPYTKQSYVTEPGDVVEVSSNGKSASTVYISIEAWADPLTDIVAGNLSPDRRVEVNLFHTLTGCSTTTYKKFTVPDALGNFQTAFNGKPDFNGLASASIYAYDGNGNSTRLDLKAFHLEYSLGMTQISGVIKPETSFDFVIIRAGQQQTDHNTSNIDGTFTSSTGGWEIQPGDMLFVHAASETLTSVASNFNAELDHKANRAIGNALPGERVVARFANQTYSSCTSRNTCRVGWVGRDGKFIINAGFDLQRGDMASFDLIDSQGNIQKGGMVHSPLILYNNGSTLEGYWNIQGRNLIITEYDSTGSNVIATQSITLPTGEDHFSVAWSASIGDIVEIRDENNIQERIIIPNLTAVLNSKTNQIEGNAGKGHMLVQMKDFRPFDGVYWQLDYCMNIPMYKQSYQIRNSRIRVGPGDSAFMFYKNPDGHIFSKVVYAFRVITSIAYPYRDSHPNSFVDVYPQKKGESVTINIKKDDQIINSPSAHDMGDFTRSYLSETDLIPGNVIEVITPSISQTLQIPTLTVDQDEANNAVSGLAIPNQQARISLFMFNNWEFLEKRVTRVTRAGSDGAYYISMKNTYFLEGKCQFPAKVGGTYIKPVLATYTSEGHAFFFGNPNVGYDYGRGEVDLYESDDTPDQAKPYLGPQHHYLREPADTDWVSVTVNPEDIGKTFSFEIYNFRALESTYLPWLAGLYTYDGNNTHLIAGPGMYGYAGYNNTPLIFSFRYTFYTSGTYYVNIYNAGSYTSRSVGGAVYDLVIRKGQ